MKLGLASASAKVSSRGCVDRELLRDLMEELNGGQRCKMAVDAAPYFSHIPILPLSVSLLRIHGACGSGLGAVPGCSSEHRFGKTVKSQRLDDSNSVALLSRSMPFSTKLKLWQPVGLEVAVRRWFVRFQRGAPTMAAFRVWLSHSGLRLNL